MLTVNLDIQDRLINGQTENIRNIKFSQGCVKKVYIKFSDEQAGLKVTISSYLGRKHYWAPIEI